MPYGVAVSDDGKKLLVTSQAGDDALLLNAETLLPVAHIGTGRYPEGVVFDATGKRADVANWFSGGVSMLDLDRNVEVEHIPVAEGPSSLGYGPGARLCHRN